MGLDFQFTNQRLLALRGDKPQIFYWMGQAKSLPNRDDLLIHYRNSIVISCELLFTFLYVAIVQLVFIRTSNNAMNIVSCFHTPGMQMMKKNIHVYITI